MNQKHSANAVAAKARLRMERPAPDYPPLLDYDAPVESWTFRDYRRERTHKLVLFHSPRRRGSFRVMVNGKEWSKCIGYDRLIRKTGKALAK